MIHRARRHLATLPARRGMRAPWLRCRIPDELIAAAEAGAGGPGGGESGAPVSPELQGAPAPPDVQPAPGVPSRPEPPTSPAPAAVRPAFGHPTF